MENLKITLFLFLTIAFFGNTVISQSRENMKVAYIKNGKIYLSNPEFLKGFFNKKIENSGKLGLMDIRFNADAGLAYVSAKVSGNRKNITCVGLSLIARDNDVYYIPVGPEGMENFLNKSSIFNTCVSEICKSCSLKVVSWEPFNTKCEAEAKIDKDCKCDHSLSISTIDFELEIPPEK